MIIISSRIFQNPEQECTTSYSQSFMTLGYCLGSFMGRTLYHHVQDLDQNPGHDFHQGIIYYTVSNNNNNLIFIVTDDTLRL